MKTKIFMLEVLFYLGTSLVFSQQKLNLTSMSCGDGFNFGPIYVLDSISNKYTFGFYMFL